MLEKKLRIDCELDLSIINLDFYSKLKSFGPYGIANPEPVFASVVVIQNLRTVGQDNKHLKLTVFARSSTTKQSSFDAIAFNQGNAASKLSVGMSIKIAYSIIIDTYNGNHKLQLKVKDIWTN